MSIFDSLIPGDSDYWEPTDGDICDDCGWVGPGVECVGGAYWCKDCQQYYRDIPPPTEAGMAVYEEDSERDKDGNRI